MGRVPGISSPALVHHIDFQTSLSAAPTSSLSDTFNCLSDTFFHMAFFVPSAGIPLVLHEANLNSAQNL